jgi:16S rRNA (uracil1498-N3)-methyltransferase
MPLRRIYCPHPLKSHIQTVLDGDAANHVLRVLRLRTGDELVLFDGSGCDFTGRVHALGRDRVTIDVDEGRVVERESPLQIVLLQGVSRGPRMDIVIQKATELGVMRIQPILAERSVVRLDEEGASRKQEHWQRVAIAAAEQSGRSRIPEVAAPLRLEAALGSYPGMGTGLLLDPEGRGARELAPPVSPVSLLIGPEGGFSDSESRLARDSGFIGLRLGPRILRTETAPLAALAVLQLIAGDF